jgi:hypothetical protein
MTKYRITVFKSIDVDVEGAMTEDVARDKLDAVKSELDWTDIDAQVFDEHGNEVLLFIVDR